MTNGAEITTRANLARVTQLATDAEAKHRQWCNTLAARAENFGRDHWQTREAEANTAYWSGAAFAFRRAAQVLEGKG